MNQNFTNYIDLFFVLIFVFSFFVVDEITDKNSLIINDGLTDHLFSLIG